MKGLAIVINATAILLSLCSPIVGEAATRARFRAESVLNDAPARISASPSNTCQVNEDGTVRCWGANNFGQLGNGTTTTEPTRVPVLVSGLGTAIAVATGGAHTCALLFNSTVQCWGANNGRLGDGTINDRLTPTPVAGITTAVAIASGGSHTCAVLANGTLRCWGANGSGQLGDGTTFSRLSPVTVVSSGSTPLTNVVAVAMGFRHTCALLSTGSVRCWGENVFGQIGIGTVGANQLIPVVIGGVSRAIAITASVHHTCVLLASGTARCWGLQGSTGLLGDGTTVDRRAPVTVSGLVNAAAIETGDSHTCALLANGNAQCWGDNSRGQIGDATTGTRLVPVSVGNSLNPLSNAVAITAGGAHTCAVLADGSAKCWGINESGQLGISNTAPASIVPTPVLGGGGSFTARDIAAGRNHTCAVRANATVACWGSNDSGQLGDGTTTARLSATLVTGLTDPVAAIAAGDAHTCALVASGTVRCWGDNDFGQLGDGTTLERRTPVTVPGIVNAVGIVAGGTLGSAHTCVSLADGTVRCWGSNGSGQLGTGTTLASRVPVTVPGLTDVVAIAAGEFHTCALTALGASFCWGFNGSGRLGDGTLSTSLVPKLVSLDNTVAIVGGNSHTCALRADGTPWCWGANLLGQLGINSTVSQSVPRLVVNLLDTTAIAGGFGHTCALIAAGGLLTGEARCWGDNSVGQLGNATTTSSLTPQVVKSLRTIGGFNGTFTIATPLSRAAVLTTGRRHSCVIHVNGAVSCWGDNSSGQLGINSTTSFVTSPSVVPSFALNIDPSVISERNDRVSTVTVVANCEDGQRLRLLVLLNQDSVWGQGFGAGRCTGRLERYPVTVRALGRHGFNDGAAQVAAAAIIRERGSIVDIQQWTRAVQIHGAP